MITTKIFFLILLNCLVQLMPASGSSENLLESWKSINAIYDNDLQQSNQIYNKLKEEQHALAELRSIMERHLRTKNAELLVNAINANNNSVSKNNVKEILEDLTDNYDNQMVDSIFAEAIDEIILTKELPTLPKLLWSICGDNDTKLFELMLRGQLQLYNSFGQRHHTDQREFLHYFANRLSKIQQNSMYDDVELSLKIKVQNIIDLMPQHLKYLYFTPYFCLLNVRYSTFIYTAIEAKVDPLSRYIWLWRDNRSMDDTGYIAAEVGELNENNGKQLIVLLKGIKYQMYYYMMPNTMKIAGWDHAGTPLNYIWNMEFLDDSRVVFSQNDYLMCAAESYDNDRRNIRGRKNGEVSSMSSECQWLLDKCAFK